MGQGDPLVDAERDAADIDAEIEANVAEHEPPEVAGTLTIDGVGGAFATGIEDDHDAVVGLSLPELWRPGVTRR